LILRWEAWQSHASHLKINGFFQEWIFFQLKGVEMVLIGGYSTVNRVSWMVLIFC
jgi:hypothetical protein